ncbi:hypothetical protein tb265_32400 [Gemmatimonadetes bacterium T265]|nr:hypothetical protein tb265_32400 [Gemmatimonadetes bacterium T265]
MPRGLSTRLRSETEAVASHALLVLRAHVLRDVSRGTSADGARAFLVYVDGVPLRWRFARSGRAAEACERRARGVPAHEAERVRAVWVPAAPLADLARVLRTPEPPGRGGRRRDSV